MNKLSQTLLVLTALLILNACSNSKTQSKKYFRINSNQMAVTEQQKPLTLVVKRPTALSILGGRPMVATKEDDSLVQLSNHFWIESPKVLLQDILKSWAQGQWQQVSTQTPHQQPHQILNTRILAFEKNMTQAKVALEFNLYDEENHLLISEQFTQIETLDGDGYKAFARAIGKAIDAILNQFSDKL